MLVHENEVTWQSLIQELVKNEGMNPWDIDISRITQAYIDAIKTLKKHDFRISGKVVLAAAILLKIKSARFVDEDMLELDRLINSQHQEMTEDEFYDDIAHDFHIPGNISEEEKHQLIPRTPQPRKRKVSIYDLMEALDQALEVRRRRVINSMPSEEELLPPIRNSVDLSVSIKTIYKHVKHHYTKEKKKKLTFSELCPSESREDKVMTFIPLLYLENIHKIFLEQEEHLAEIDISLMSRASRAELEKELA
jgi:segregation and condensation protein A